ncbi:MAG: D-2-hydroxyacid dehydrogenase family protein [Burkholderiaceae bacterium]
MRIAILDDTQDLVRHLDCFDRLAAHEVRVFNHPARGLGQLAARLADTEALILIRERTRISDALLARLPALKLISQTGRIGPHLDLEACERRDIVVTESAGYAPATAEFAWLLILAALRRLVPYAQQLQSGHWQRSLPLAPHWPLAPMGECAAGKALGIWGYGRIGRLVAGYGRAFGMKVVVHGRSASMNAAMADGCVPCPDRSEFFATADVLSLHLRLLPATQACVSAELLAQMKPTALLVNTSRAELIAPDALAAALQLGRPGLAAIDVWEQEPVSNTNPLLALRNVLATPHLGYVERHSYETLLGGAIDNLLAFAADSASTQVTPTAPHQ